MRYRIIETVPVKDTWWVVHTIDAYDVKPGVPAGRYGPDDMQQVGINVDVCRVPCMALVADTDENREVRAVYFGFDVDDVEVDALRVMPRVGGGGDRHEEFALVHGDDVKIELEKMLENATEYVGDLSASREPDIRRGDPVVHKRSRRRFQIREGAVISDGVAS